MDCRQSGLSDHEWCQEHDIKPSTFYNWIRRLRQNGCTDIQEFKKCLPQETQKQDVVRISFQEQSYPSSTVELRADHEPRDQQSPPLPVMEISIGGIKLRITNGFDSNLLSQTLKTLRELVC
jgi:transposase-like protein